MRKGGLFITVRLRHSIPHSSEGWNPVTSALEGADSADC
jgi:hypothetical protein